MKCRGAVWGDLALKRSRGDADHFRHLASDLLFFAIFKENTIIMSLKEKQAAWPQKYNRESLKRAKGEKEEEKEEKYQNS